MRKYEIIGIPRPQGRPRFFKRGNFVAAYDPKESRHYKENVSAQLASQNPEYHESAPLVVAVDFHLPRPTSLPKKVVDHAKKPDLDNLIKGLFDAATGILWKSDAQVCVLSAHKYYTTGEPRVNLVVTPVT